MFAAYSYCFYDCTALIPTVEAIFHNTVEVKGLRCLQKFRFEHLVWIKSQSSLRNLSKVKLRRFLQFYPINFA